MFTAWALPEPVSRWAPMPVVTLVLRGVAMVVVAPASEELVFRGLVIWRLAGTRLKEVGAVVFSAALFAVMHWQYGPADLALVFADGLLFGAARVRSRSIFLTFALHALGNAIALSQRWPLHLG